MRTGIKFAGILFVISGIRDSDLITIVAGLALFFSV